MLRHLAVILILITKGTLELRALTLLRRLTVKEFKSFVLTLSRLMSYIYGAPILDVSRSHTTTQHSR